MNPTDYPEIDSITDQVDRYSQAHAHFWRSAIANWDGATKAAFCGAVKSLRNTAIMNGRVAKIIGGYTDGPLRGQPILVFGEVPVGGGEFEKGTNQLIFNLNGSEYWKYPFTRGLTQHIRIK